MVPSRWNSSFILWSSINARASVRQYAAQTPWRTAANYSDLSTRWHIMSSSVGEVLNGLWLRLDYIINVTPLV